MQRGYALLIPVLFTLSNGLATGTVSATTRPFNLPAGEARDTLNQFSAQADSVVIFDFKLIEHHPTHAVSGDLEVKDALKTYLQGSGLSSRITESGMIYVDDREPTSSTPSRHRLPPNGADGLKEEPITTPANPVVYVQAPLVHQSVLLPYEPSVTSLQYSVSDIGHSGESSAAGFVRLLPFNFGGGAAEQSQLFGREAQANPAFGTGFNIHGLGSRATLVLVDNHRLAPSGSSGTFYDVSNIPISAVQEIQVRPAGGSIFAGEDGIAGVVNFVLREETAPTETLVRLSEVGRNSVGERLVSHSFGHVFSCGGSVFAAEYYQRDALYAKDRAQASSDLTRWGGNNFGDPAGNPGTLVDSTQAEWALPPGQDGTHLDISQLKPGPNLHDRSRDATILPLQQRFSLMVRAHSECWEKATLWIEAFGSRRHVEASSAGVTATLPLPSSNPWFVSPAPGPVQVLYGFGSDLGPQTVNGTVYTGQTSFGITQPLAHDWKWESFVTYAAETQKDEFGNQVDFNALEASLEDPDPATAFNPFGDGSHTNAATVAAIRTKRWAHYASRLTSFNGRMSGPTFALRAGALSVDVGFERRLQTFFGSTTEPTTQPVTESTGDIRRSMTAFYVHTQVPLLAFAHQDSGQPRLLLTAAIRNEHYNDVGNALAPQVGLAFWPLRSVEAGVGWGRYFRPPNLSDLTEIGNLSTLTLLTDASSKTGFTETLAWTGGNNALKPESADSLVGHITFAPTSKSGTSITASYYHTKFSQMVQSFDLSFSALTDPQYAWLINRDLSADQRQYICTHSRFVGVADDCLNVPVGALADIRLHNAATLSTDGVDLVGHAPLDTPLGHFTFDLTATYVMHYTEALTPTSPTVSLLDHPHYPLTFRGRFTAGWQRRGFAIATTTNYQSGYGDPDSVPPRHVSSWTTWDLMAMYRFPVNPFFGGTALTIGVHALNVFNKGAPFLNNAIEQVGYDTENATLLGRRVGIDLQMSW